ncbi:hypothetical protein GQ457_11G025360 [Hibiscus cannabinus]
MAAGKEVQVGVEWRITVADGSSEALVPATGLARKIWVGIKGILWGFGLKVWMFLKRACVIGANDPRKVIHCLKVGLALALVSLFYFIKPLYDGVGGNSMWALMTVVLVFETTVVLDLDRCSVLILHSASAATFSRLIPSVKSLFDYGAMVFILTFSFVVVSGYRVDKLFELTHNRISTIIIGTSLCTLVNMFICPIWSGQELHSLIVRNMDKLADSLDGCVTQYFNQSGECTNSVEVAAKKLQGYKCVLSSKASEESMANFARWEPPHGKFNFRYPWKQYLKIGSSMRSCAYCIEALNSCIDSESQQATKLIKKHVSTGCLKLSSSSSNAVRELAEIVKTMKKSSTIDLLVGEMNSAVQELQNDLKSLPGLWNRSTVPENKTSGAACSEATPALPLMEMIPVVTLASILIEISAQIEAFVDAVEELSNLAEFGINNKCKQSETVKALQRV